MKKEININETNIDKCSRVDTEERKYNDRQNNTTRDIQQRCNTF